MNGLKPGTVVHGRYRILGKAGEGGLGQVYLAEDLVAGGRVAFKVGFGSAAGWAGREPPVHPNLARVIEAGEWEGRPYQVFDWVEGTDLATHLRLNGRSDLPTACRLGSHIAAGLAALHAAGLVHGDVKPRNVIVSPGDGGPTARLVDFGAVPAADQPVVATPVYAAPEVLAGRQPTPAADAFSLGVLLFELLTGISPAPDAVGDGPLRPALWNPAVPPALDDLVARLTAPDPEQRPGDLQQVARTLGAWATPDLTPTVPLRPTARLRPARRPRRPSPGSLAVLAGLVLVLGLLLGFRLTQPAGGPEPSGGETARAAPATPPAAVVPAVVGMPSERAIQVLAGAGLRPETRQAYSQAAAGLVIKQAPPAGTEVAPGATVTLTVSAGPAPAQADDDRRGPDRGQGKKRGRDD